MCETSLIPTKYHVLEAAQNVPCFLNKPCYSCLRAFVHSIPSAFVKGVQYKMELQTMKAQTVVFWYSSPNGLRHSMYKNLNIKENIVHPQNWRKVNKTGMSTVEWGVLRNKEGGMSKSQIMEGPKGHIQNLGLYSKSKGESYWGVLNMQVT